MNITTEEDGAPMSSITIEGGAPVENSLTVEDDTLTPGASDQTGTETTETGSSPAADTEGTKTARVRPFDRLAALATVDGWLVFLTETMDAAVEQAVKDDPAFKPPVVLGEVATLVGETLALVLSETGPKLTALAAACAGARTARLTREAAHRVACKRTKMATAKASKDREAAQREVESLKAKLAALETALAPSKATT